MPGLGHRWVGSSPPILCDFIYGKPFKSYKKIKIHEPVFVVACKAVDHNGHWKSHDEDST